MTKYILNFYCNPKFKTLNLFWIILILEFKLKFLRIYINLTQN